MALTYSPGLSVMQGISAANQAHSGLLQNVAAMNQLREWDRQEGVRSLLRDIAYDQALTKRETEAQSNKALRALGKVRDSLYNGSKDSYMKALDMVSPLSNGQTRRLSSDGKSIETVGLDGQVLGITPNYSGKMAERAMLQNYGMDILRERDIFFDREARDQMANLQMASMQNRALNEQNEMLMKALMDGISSRGRGSGGGKGKGSGDGDFPNINMRDVQTMWGMVDNEAANVAGLPRDAEGNIDYAMATPEQLAAYDSTRMILGRNLNANVYQGNQPLSVAWYDAIQQTRGYNKQAQQTTQQKQNTPKTKAEQLRAQAEATDKKTPTYLTPERLVLGTSPMGQGLSLFLNPAYNNAI